VQAFDPVPGTLSRRTVLITTLLMLGLAAAIVAAAQFTDTDLRLAYFYFDSTHRTFPWDHTWFGQELMHHYLKDMIIVFGLLLIGTVLLDRFSLLPRISPLLRLQLRLAALASILEPLLVSSLKASSVLHCPSNIDLFGGKEPYLRLLDAIPQGWHAGHCFPAGHASAGMWLSALAVFWLPHRPRTALAVFSGGLAFGIGMGWVQQMRGLHFLSHTLTTAWLSSALLLTMLAFSWRALQAAARLPHPHRSPEAAATLVP